MKIKDIWNQKNLIRFYDSNSLERKMRHLVEWEVSHPTTHYQQDVQPTTIHSPTQEHIDLLEKLVNG